ncbi:hypothetical protein ZIOFF_019609 [Zingiber officinale]|uniref:Gnk2-homologous domain-containing protein n=1 Tax=Zingiber officinale TaxID=94328 RepID=A0A8J5H9W4_ZINOF|nr:hypothetical protein ZIOFF_019609 [Zingiber officinale]
MLALGHREEITVKNREEEGLVVAAMVPSPAEELAVGDQNSITRAQEEEMLPQGRWKSSDSTLVTTGCANQTLSAVYSYIHPLTSVSSTLTTQAATSKFYKVAASSSSLGGQHLFALFQCRGDLSFSACVTRVPMWTSLCGGSVAAARVQLNGCYALYQAPGFPQVSGTQMLYKTCGAGGSGSDCEAKRDTVFSQLQSGVAAGHGFYATS